MPLRSAVILTGCLTIGSALLGLIYALTSTPIYLAQATLMPAGQESASEGLSAAGLGGLASIAGLNVAPSDSLRVEALATLKSRAFLVGFANEQSLDRVLFAELWDDTRLRWDQSAPTSNDVYARFLDDVLSISEDPSTGIVTLGVKWTDPDTSAQWANALVEAINEVMRARAAKMSQESLEYLTRELSSSSNTALRQSIGALIEKQVNRAMLARVRTEYAYRVIDPATAPDYDDPIHPKPLFLVAGGLALGFFTSLGLVALWNLVEVQPLGPSPSTT